MQALTITHTPARLRALPPSRPAQRTKPTCAATSESRFIARLRDGDAAAFETLVNQHHGGMIRMALGYVSDRDVAEEVVQDTWIAVINGLVQFEARSSLRTWIFGILINKAKDRGVRESRHTTFADLVHADKYSDDDSDDEAIDPARFHQCAEQAGAWALPPRTWEARTPEKLLASKQTVGAIQQALNALPTSLSDVLVLRDVEGCETREICDLLRISEANLHVRLHRARERVRRALETHLDRN